MRNCKNKSPVAKSVVDLTLHYFASVPENTLLLQSCPLLSYYAFYIAFLQNMLLQTETIYEILYKNMKYNPCSCTEHGYN